MHIFFAGLLFLLLVCSIAMNVSELRWKADIQTANGMKKLHKLNYERLELQRLRLRQIKQSGRRAPAERDYFLVPLDENFSESRRDTLRVYGWKNGKRHFVYRMYCTEATVADLNSIVETYNASVSAKS